MPHERKLPTDPEEWLRRAKSNLERSKMRSSSIYLEDLCFDAQQAAEKALKALLLKRGVSFPYVHDLAHLATLLEQAGQELPEFARQAESLTRYAVITRYPGFTEPVSEEQYQEAISLAEAVVRWAESIILGKRDTSKRNKTIG